MINKMGRVTGFALLIWLTACAQPMLAQKLRPGLPGMAPSKWITIRNTDAPGRIYQYAGSAAKTYTQEDVFFKAWIPVVNLPKMTLLLGPQYRTEQLEFQSTGENPLHLLSNWNLRSMGLDIRGCLQVDSLAWLAFNVNVNQSGNLHGQPHGHVPINYTLSSIYIKRSSTKKEIGFGLMANRSFNRFIALPVFVYNYNYSRRGGIEISLPYKISWRNNLSPTDLLYVKAEAMTRSYWINGSDHSYAFRRTELDLGIAYNKQFNRLMGAEIFGGYRRNISTRLPGEVTGIKTSGFVFSLELYLRSPFK
jgi:hypothetical protein